MHVGISSNLVRRRGWIITVISVNKVPVPVLIVHDKASDRFYAMDAVCAHFGCGMLTDVQGLSARCPIHGAVYDLRTGNRVTEPSSNPSSPCGFCAGHVPLRTYAVHDDNGTVDLEVERQFTA